MQYCLNSISDYENIINTFLYFKNLNEFDAFLWR